MPHSEYLQQLIKDIKRELMFEVIMSMRKGYISKKEAHFLAKDFLKIFPIKNIEDFFKKLVPLYKKYPEVRPVYLKHAKPYEKIKSKMMAESLISVMNQSPKLSKN